MPRDPWWAPCSLRKISGLNNFGTTILSQLKKPVLDFQCFRRGNHWLKTCIGSIQKSREITSQAVEAVIFTHEN